MSKCKHKTGRTIFQAGDFSITKCDWGCGKYLFQGDVTGYTVTLATMDVDELSKFVQTVDAEVWINV